MTDQISIKDDTVTLLKPLLTGQLSRNTLRAYKNDLEDFFGVSDLAQLTKQMIQSVTIQQIIDFRNNQLSRHKPATVARKLSTLRAVFDYFLDAGIVETNPAKNSWVKSPKVPTESLANGLTQKEAEELIAQPNRNSLVGKRDYAILQLMLNNGLRRNEVINLKISDLRMEGSFYVLSILGKGGKLRLAKLKPQVWQAINEYLNARTSQLDLNEHIFQNHFKGVVPWQKTFGKISAETIRQLIQKYLNRINVQKRITPHSLRHTFTTLAIEGGAKIHQVQAALGHSDPKTTMRYFRHRDNLADNATDYIHLPG